MQEVWVTATLNFWFLSEKQKGRDSKNSYTAEKQKEPEPHERPHKLLFLERLYPLSNTFVFLNPVFWG